MTCSQSGQIDAYLLDELPAAERAAFEEHLSGCEFCADEIGRFDAFVTETREAEDTPALSILLSRLSVGDRKQIETLLQSVPADDPPARSMALAASVLLALTVLNECGRTSGILSRENISMVDTSVLKGVTMVEGPELRHRRAFPDNLPIFMSEA